jgi:hypothetical protein
MRWGGHVAYMGGKACRQFWQESVKEKKTTEEIEVVGRIILKLIVIEWGVN